MAGTVRRVGIVGFGSLGALSLIKGLRILFIRLLTGRFLYDELSQRLDYEVVFVWNRSVDKMRGVVPDHLILENLAECSERWDM